jgi:hypothetical protein
LLDHSIDNDVKKLMDSHPDIFTFDRLDEGLVDVRDFQTTGVMAFAKGTPLYNLQTGKRDVMGQRVVVNQEYKDNCVEHMDDLVAKL